MSSSSNNLYFQNTDKQYFEISASTLMGMKGSISIGGKVTGAAGNWFAAYIFNGRNVLNSIRGE